jgi:predicted acetyltransferase
MSAAARPSARFAVRPLRPAERPAVRRLIQLYIYDLAGDRWDTDADGRFGSRPWHRRFWTRRGRHHFVIRVRGRLVGFALVRERAHFAGRGVREVSEFFVLRKYRQQGVGTRAARWLFARFPGRWEVAELSWNVAAQKFWRHAISSYGVESLVERPRRQGDLVFVVQQFSTAQRSRGSARPR